MEQTLQAQGLDLYLVRTYRQSDPVLPVICIFDGPDADRTAERFKSYSEKDSGAMP